MRSHIDVQLTWARKSQNLGMSTKRSSANSSRVPRAVRNWPCEILGVRTSYDNKYKVSHLAKQAP